MKILIINPFGIGDVIFSTPLIEILKKEFPDSFIGYVCNKRAAGLIKTNPCVSKVFVYEKDDYRDEWKKSKARCIKSVLSFLNDIRREKFDISIDLSLTYQYSMLLKLIGVKTRIGFNYRNRGRFLTRKIDIDGFDDKHVVEYYLGLLRLLDMDVSKHKIATKIYASANSLDFGDKFFAKNGIKKNDLLILMAPGCGESWGQDAHRRRWDRKNFAGLANRLIDERGAKIVLVGNAKEAAICEEVRSMTQNRAISCCGRISIEELVGVLIKCRLLITNEGGLLHMAVGLGVKTVSLFGPVNEVNYGPYPSIAEHVVMAKKELPCRPCYKKFKYSSCSEKTCLESITVDEVFAAAEKALER
jgi:heptosyltransferase-2